MNVSEEALDSYLVWELCKQEGIQAMIMDPSTGKGKLKEIVANVRGEYRMEYPGQDEKMRLLQELDSNPDYRSRVFRECFWNKETVKIDDLGTTLPRAGGLPPDIIAGDLSKVLNFVRKADPDEYQSVKYINNLKKSQDF